MVGFKKHEPLVLVDLYEEGQEDCWPWGFNTFSTQKLVYLRKSFSTLWSVFERVLPIVAQKHGRKGPGFLVCVACSRVVKCALLCGKHCSLFSS